MNYPRDSFTSPLRARNDGFTLIELLVVIAIIAILASMLLPALSRAKSKAQRMKCVSNLKQLQLCWHMYADDFNDFAPPNNPGLNPPPPGITPLPGTEAWIYGDVANDKTPDNVRAGVLFKYNSSVAIYVCPSDRYAHAFGGVMYPTTRSYSMVSEMPPQGKKVATIYDPKPSKALVFMDEDDLLNNPYNGINDGNIGLRRYPTQAWGDSPGRRHDNGATVSMADGHAEAWSWKSTSKIFARGDITLGRGQGDNELKDLLRIQQGLPGFPN